MFSTLFSISCPKLMMMRKLAKKCEWPQINRSWVSKWGKNLNSILSWNLITKFTDEKDCCQIRFAIVDIREKESLTFCQDLKHVFDDVNFMTSSNWDFAVLFINSQIVNLPSLRTFSLIYATASSFLNVTGLPESGLFQLFVGHLWNV